MKKEEKILKKKEYLANTPRLHLIDSYQDPIYAKDTIDGIIKDSLKEIQRSSINEGDNFYPENNACNLKYFLMKIKDKLEEELKKLKTNMTPEHRLEFEYYKNSFRSRKKKLDPSTLLSLEEESDRKIRNSKPLDLGKSREEVNEIMEYINLPPVYLEYYNIVYKIDLLKKIYKVWRDINQTITPIDKFAQIPYELHNSIIYMTKDENNKYTIKCSSTEIECNLTVAKNLDADFSNLLLDKFFFKIFAFANNLNDEMVEIMYRDGGKRKTKNQREKQIKKSMKKSKKLMRKSKRKLNNFINIIFYQYYIFNV